MVLARRWRSMFSLWAGVTMTMSENSVERRGRRFAILVGAGMTAVATALALGVVWVAYVCMTPPPSVPTDGRAASLPARTYQKARAGVVRFVGEQARRYLRAGAIAQFLQTNLADDQVIARFLDDSTPIHIRRLDAWRLAERVATPYATSILFDALYKGSPELRAAVAEILGRSHHPDAKEHLSRLLDDPDPAVVMGAARGLAALGDEESVRLLGDILASAEDGRAELRAEIALALGDVGTAEARDALLNGYRQARDPDLRETLVDSLGKYPFADTGELFRALVNDESADIDVRTRAVEALAANSGDAIAFLSETVVAHKDPEIRASAAWALGVNDGTGEYGEFIAAQLAVEKDSVARRRLFEAMTRQRVIPLDAVEEQATREEDLAARVAAANAWAVGLRGEDVSLDSKNRFDLTIVPELLDTALAANSTNLRMRSVFALRRAGTPAAVAALSRVAASDGQPKVVQAARNALNAMGINVN